jgi:hypothetical protein
MAVIFIKKNAGEAATQAATVDATPTKAKHKNKKPGQARRLPIHDVCFEKPQRLRVGHLLTIFQISAPQLYNMRASGKIPPPAGYFGEGKRPTPYWLSTDIAKFI